MRVQPVIGCPEVDTLSYRNGQGIRIYLNAPSKRQMHEHSFVSQGSVFIRQCLLVANKLDQPHQLHVSAALLTL